MINLIPENYKKFLETDYKFRRLALIFWFIFLVSLISLVFYLPAHILTKVKANEIVLQEAQLGLGVSNEASVPTSKNLSEAITALSRANKLTDEINAKMAFSDAFETLKILESKPTAIRIYEILYSNLPEKAALLNIRGVAGTREGLTMFGRFLGTVERLEKIDIPISNFVKDTNLEFSVTAEIRRPEAAK